MKISELKNIRQVLLVICDGMGESSNTQKNAVRDAKTPCLDALKLKYPFTTLTAGGEIVGLPEGVAGNSEVGHMNMGAGRPVRQDLVRINEAISNNTLRDMDTLKKFTTNIQNQRVHLMGLLSDGGVHSHISHLKYLIDYFHEQKMQIYLHLFMDGRDTPPDSGLKYLTEINSFIENKNCSIASTQGRSIGMDRDRRWEKIQNCYQTLIGKNGIAEQSPIEALESDYKQKIFDEFLTPKLFLKDGAITSEDSVFFTNFRPDRAKQISLAFTQSDFAHFKTELKPFQFLCMTPYIDEECPMVPILFNREKIPNTLSEYLSKQKLKQLKIAETEKYAHVTYFFNGGAEKPFAGEERILINSPKDVATYDLKPQMSAFEVKDQLLKKLDDNTISLYVCNFANADMVGHTGNYSAAVKAVEAVDACLHELVQKCLQKNIALLITADHGNADEMVYSDGGPHTSHTKAPVPFLIVHPEVENSPLKPRGEESERGLKDIAPTLLSLLKIPYPEDFTGTSIFL